MSCTARYRTISIHKGKIVVLKHSIQKQKPVLVVEKLTQGETRLTEKNYGFATRVEIVSLSFLPAFALLGIVGFSQ